MGPTAKPKRSALTAKTGRKVPLGEMNFVFSGISIESPTTFGEGRIIPENFGGSTPRVPGMEE